MSKIRMKKGVFFSLFVTILVQFLLIPKEVFAQNVNIQCEQGLNYVQPVGNNIPPTMAINKNFEVTVNFFDTADNSLDYFVQITNKGDQLIGPVTLGDTSIDSNKLKKTPGRSTITFTVPDQNKDRVGVWKVTLKRSPDNVVCQLGTINFYSEDLNQSTCNIVMPGNVQQDQSFYYKVEKRDVDPDIKYVLYFLDKSSLTTLSPGLNIVAPLAGDLGMSESAFISANPLPIVRLYTNGKPEKYKLLLPQNQPDPAIVPPNLGYVGITYSNSGAERLLGGDYTAVVEVQKKQGGNYLVSYCSSHDFSLTDKATSPPTPGTPITQPGMGGIIGGGKITSETCLQRAKKDPINVKCMESGGKPCGDNGIETAIGCIHTQPTVFVKDILKFIVAIAGGIAFLLMILGVFGMITSAGNPDNLQAGKDRLTSAIIGLLFVVLSVLLLKIIGVDILGLGTFLGV